MKCRLPVDYLTVQALSFVGPSMGCMIIPYVSSHFHSIVDFQDEAFCKARAMCVYVYVKKKGARRELK